MLAHLRTDREELANVVTHGLGLLLAGAAGVFLLVRGDTRAALTAVPFILGLVCVYAASTGYHAAVGQAKERWRSLDHAAIYVLIAGTYHAVVLYAPGGRSGLLFAGLVWLLAGVGVVRKLLRFGRPTQIGPFDLTLYIALGWVWVLLAGPIYRGLSVGGFGWLLAGGVSYTLGTIFFSLDRIPFNHAVWHLFVLVGSGCHFAAVAFFR